MSDSHPWLKRHIFQSDSLLFKFGIVPPHAVFSYAASLCLLPLIALPRPHVCPSTLPVSVGTSQHWLSEAGWKIYCLIHERGILAPPEKPVTALSLLAAEHTLQLIEKSLGRCLRTRAAGKAQKWQSLPAPSKNSHSARGIFLSFKPENIPERNSLSSSWHNVALNICHLLFCKLLSFL